MVKNRIHPKGRSCFVWPIYHFINHNIRISFDNFPVNSSVWIGVAVDDQPPSPDDLLKTVGWFCEVGDAFGNSLTGDGLRRNFYWQHQGVSAENERTLCNHTIYNVIRPRQLVMIMQTIGTVVSLLPMCSACQSLIQSPCGTYVLCSIAESYIFIIIIYKVE